MRSAPLDQEVISMIRKFKVGDRVRWNSEAGLVTGTIKKKITSQISFKRYTVHASKEEPQYLIKSDKTDHLACFRWNHDRRDHSRLPVP